jgi:hypothetical protein
MINKQSIPNEHEIASAHTRRRQIRLMQVIFAGAATVASLALFSTARPGDAGTAVASGPATAQFIPRAAPSGAGDRSFASDGGVNDNGQTSGDIFTQNAQDQSTA